MQLQHPRATTEAESAPAPLVEEAL